MKILKDENNLGLDEIPVFGNSLTLGDHLLISDTFGSDGGLSETELVPISKKFLNSPFRIKFTIILVCLNGSLKIRVRMKECLLSRGSMLLITEGTIGEFLEVSGRVNVLMIAFSRFFKVMEPGFRPSMEILDKVHKHPCLSLNEQELKDIMAIYKIMRHRMEDRDFQANEELATSCLTTLFYYVSQHIADGCLHKVSGPGRSTAIHNEFLDLVENHSLSHRDLAFYADRLCITTKYLSRVVSAASGRSPKEWINMRVMLEAEVLLRNKSRSIQEISDILGFPNQSFFGTYFKKEKGLSPSAYRRFLK